jgi:hypothetical protein
MKNYERIDQMSRYLFAPCAYRIQFLETAVRTVYVLLGLPLDIEAGSVRGYWATVAIG